MDVLNTLKQALKTSAGVIKWGAGLQESTRKNLIAELQEICTNCEAAYDAVSRHFSPAELVELTAVAAAFEMFSRFNSALQIPVTPLPGSAGK